MRHFQSQHVSGRFDKCPEFGVSRLQGLGPGVRHANRSSRRRSSCHGLNADPHGCRLGRDRRSAETETGQIDDERLLHAIASANPSTRFRMPITNTSDTTSNSPHCRWSSLLHALNRGGSNGQSAADLVPTGGRLVRQNRYGWQNRRFTYPTRKVPGLPRECTEATRVPADPASAAAVARFRP